MIKESEAQITKKAAERLKTIIEKPEWASFVKTGMQKQRPPEQADWWFYRAGSVLRTVNRLGPIGVSKLRNKYGGKKNRGHKTEHTYKGSGKIIRVILQELEQAGLIKQEKKGLHKGRVITAKGKEVLFGHAAKKK
jgi:small subunit ribosomal protein S19e